MFSNQNGWLILLGILIFALGEMGSSPKFTEYVGKIAPADKKALYMGTSFLPIAAAHQLAGWLSGDIYERIADKIYLLKQEVAKQGLSIPEISGEFTKNDYLNMAAEKMGMNLGELDALLWQNYITNRTDCQRNGDHNDHNCFGGREKAHHTINQRISCYHVKIFRERGL